MSRRDPDHLLVACAYDGRAFHGAWPQPDLPTVASALYARLELAIGRRPDAFAVVARTDAGVHASINLATVRLWRDADTQGIEQAEAPRDDGLIALRVHRVPSTVHARGMARRKRYRYVFDEDLDADAMDRAAQAMRGRLDVSALRGRRVAPERCVDVNLERVEIQSDGGIALVVEGDRFVRHQVRIMAAVLAQVGRGERHPDSLPELLASRDRRRAAPPAPGPGLTLEGLQLRGRPERWITDVDSVDLAELCASELALQQAGISRRGRP